jgi:hypothetical protein
MKKETDENLIPFNRKSPKPNGRGDVRPVPKPSQVDRITGGDDGGPIEPGTRTPFGGYWCSCKAGVVFLPGNLCLACREGWTPAEYRAV